MTEQNLRNRLDERYADILRAIRRSNGTASTSDIKRLTGIETNQIITQRMDRLEEWGLVETGHRDKRHSNHLPVKVATMTGHGRQVIEDGLLDGLGDEERMRGIEEMGERLDTLERRLAALEDDYDELDDEVWELRDNQNVLRRRAASENDVDELRDELTGRIEDVAEELDSWEVTVEGIRRFLVEEANADLIPFYPAGEGD